MKLRHFLGWTTLLPVVLLLSIASSAQRRRPEASDSGMHFRFVGPAVGNRVASFAGVPGNPNVYYAGAASGGVWKSDDGGIRWEPIFDKQDVAAIGALAVAPSDPNVVYAGTGEAWAIRDTDVAGDGMYKSTDAGKTWAHIGLEATGRIGQILVDPKDPDIAFACALGRMTGPQQERGVFRTKDGGKTWDRVLFVDENTGCSAIAMDSHDSRVLFAGTWQVEMHTYAELSGGPGSGVFVSRDGGTTWKRIEGHGLPKSPVGKIGVAIAPSNSNRVYALIEAPGQGSVWRSDNGGEDWTRVSWDRTLIGRAGYYMRIAVSPSDENDVVVASSEVERSLDGGYTFQTVPWGGDTHDIWMDPRNPDRFAISDDGGINLTTNGGHGFHRIDLPIAQLYHVAVDDQIPYYIYGNMQDDGNMRGPNISSGRGFGPQAGWDHAMGGCESGFTIPDPTDPNIVWATCYGNEVTRWDARTKMARSVSPWFHTLDSPPNAIKYRCHWTPPLAIDPFDHNTVYYGCQVVFKTSNGGQSWSVISPDLSTQDPSRIISSGGLIPDNLGQFYGEVVYAIAPSTVQKGLIWAGTNDGQLWYTSDGGGKWNNVTKSMTGLPAWGTVTSIQPSFFDAGTAYVSIDLHLMDNRDPFIYKTTDFGKSWTRIDSALPRGPLSYVRIVAEDPNQKGLLFAGTGNALYYSHDSGASWTRLKEGLPPAPVSWLVVQKRFHDLVVSTYGRGFYILDDITPLEQMAQHANEAAARFFTPRPAYRLSREGRAYLNYWLPSETKGPVKLEILGADGKLIRELRGSKKQGINRVSWDLCHAGPEEIELRTTPAVNPAIWTEPRFRDKTSRPVLHWGVYRLTGPMVLPGKYTARLTVDRHTYSQTIDVLPDPHLDVDAASLARSVDLQLQIRDDITRVARIVNKLEWTRKQLEDVTAMLKSEKKNDEVASTDIAALEAAKDTDTKDKKNGPDGGTGDLLKAVLAMDKNVQRVEHEFISQELTYSDGKFYVEPFKLYYDLIWLNAEIGPGAGDVAGGAAFPATDTAFELYKKLKQQLQAAVADYDSLTTKDLPTFNQVLLRHGIMPATVPKTEVGD